VPRAFLVFGAYLCLQDSDIYFIKREVSKMGKLVKMMIFLFFILQVGWIGFKIIIENTPEFPNLIFPFGVMFIAAGLMKWSNESY
jgi:hypothetical protein